MQKIRNFIHRLRNRSEEERRHLLHIFTFVFAIIIVVLWIFSLSKSLTTEETKIKVKNDLEPFSILKDNLVESYESATQSKTNNSVNQ